VPFGFVADHTVGGIGDFVEHQCGQSADGEPEGGGDDAVREIFSAAFDGTTADGACVHVGGVPSDDLRDCAASVTKREPQGVPDGRNVIHQGFLCQEDCTDDDLADGAEGDLQEGTKGHGPECEGEHDGCAFGLAIGPVVEAFVERPDELPHEDRGMRELVPKPAGFAQGGVEQHGECENQNAFSNCAQRSGAGSPSRNQLSA